MNEYTAKIRPELFAKRRELRAAGVEMSPIEFDKARKVYAFHEVQPEPTMFAGATDFVLVNEFGKILGRDADRANLGVEKAFRESYHRTLKIIPAAEYVPPVDLATILG